MEFVKNLQGHRGYVTGLVFRKDTSTLYSAADDRCVKVWNLDDMAYVESLLVYLIYNQHNNLFLIIIFFFAIVLDIICQ